MARQSGPIFIEGTLDDLTFYKMDGEYYVRMKSRLTRNRVLKSPKFALTRMHASQLTEASKIASIIYKQIPKEEKNIKLFRTIVGNAKVLLSKGKEKEEILNILSSEFIKPRIKEIAIKENNSKNPITKSLDVKKANFVRVKSKRVLTQMDNKRKWHKSTILDRTAAPYGALSNESLCNSE